MENKYITVAYKLYVMQDGQKTLVEESGKGPGKPAGG